MPDEFDAVVVGAGMAGNAAALRMAQHGLQVLLVDRGKPIGSKNLSGGVLWGHDIGKLIPDWWKVAPVERPVTHKGVGILTETDAFSIHFETEDWKKEPYNGFMVLRARFDKWFAEQAAAAGAMVVDGVNVERLAREDGRVVGVEQAGETIRAKAVVLADGCNSRLSIEGGIRPPPEGGPVGRATGAKIPVEHALLGVKEVIAFDEKDLEKRFRIGAKEGVANEYILGYMKNGVKAGGFMYTNRDTISLGVVINLKSLWGKGVVSHDVMEQFRLHPHVQSMLEGGKVVEYGAHLIPEWGLEHAPPLVGRGYVLAGDAAGFLFSNGMVIQGMNYAVASGILAADTFIEAKKEGDFADLSAYARRIRSSFIGKDLKKFKDMHKFVWNDRLHTKYPALITGIFKDLITEDGEPKVKSREIILNNLVKQRLGPFALLSDAIQGGRNL